MERKTIKEINIRDINGQQDRFHDIEDALVCGNTLTIYFKNGDRIDFIKSNIICTEIIYDEDYINAHK